MHGTSPLSLSCGRFGGVTVRIHLLFPLFALLTLYLGWREAQLRTDDNLLVIAAVSIIVLLFSVIAHELAHALVAMRLVGDDQEVLLWPLGGLATGPAADDPRHELLTAAAGPTANLVLCLVFSPFVAAFSGGELVGLINPFQPTNLTSGPLWLVVLKLFFWVNWLLLLVNLLPAFPFDGGRVLRAILPVMWPHSGEPHATRIVSRTALVLVAGLLCLAWFVRDAHATNAVPMWFALVLLAIFLAFGARQSSMHAPASPPRDERELGEFGYDFSAGYRSLDASTNKQESDDDEEVDGPFGRWMEHRRETARRRQRELEEAEESRADEILAKLHKTGMKGLSKEDRDLLDRVSARYRSRQES